jgi:D-Lysine 5,6-aminomutase alpha subunit.
VPVRCSLEKIVNDKGEPGSVPLLQAISDGTFGLMKRPADAGKGLDGVVKRAPGYDNPATRCWKQVLESEHSRYERLARHHPAVWGYHR